VLPFRVGDDIVARVDLKADRKSCQLVVKSAHLEDGADAAFCAAELARELRSLADWLQLEHVRILRRGSFEKALGKEACLTRQT
jgi:uncharacterized protein YcaQ